MFSYIFGNNVGFSSIPTLQDKITKTILLLTIYQDFRTTLLVISAPLKGLLHNFLLKRIHSFYFQIFKHALVYT